MRLVGELDSEKKAFIFSSYLKKEGIQNGFESFTKPSGETVFRVWIEDEDDFSAAYSWYEHFVQHPEDSKFQNLALPPPLPPVLPSVEEATEEFRLEEKGRTVKLHILKKRKPFSYALTHLFLFVCILLFFWNDLQEANVLKNRGQLALELSLTPLQKALIFDYPHAMQVFDEVLDVYPAKTLEELKELPEDQQDCYKRAENLPYWKGFYAELLEKKSGKAPPSDSPPMFEKIKEGEVWRVFTPCILHRDFLHILFNMAWLWLLGRQIEERVKRFPMILLILVTGIASNFAQYLMSGPYFLGFSGVVVGMAGFIWSRQKIAPWEGYPLQKTTLLFILFFVMAMFVLEVISLGLQLFSLAEITPSIANTAHVTGGLAGLFLGRLNFFARGKE